MTVEYQRRLEKHYDELKWLYCELYPNGQGRFEELCASMEQWYKERNKKWKALDRKREKQKNWYKSQKMLGMMLYIDAFADNISGLEEKLDYLKACRIMSGPDVHLPEKKSIRTVTSFSITTTFRPNMRKPARRYSRQRHRATLPGERTVTNLS